MHGETGRTVGKCGFKGPPADGVVEIAYGIDPEYQGKGYATEAAEALTNVAFSKAFAPFVPTRLPKQTPRRASSPSAASKLSARSSIPRTGRYGAGNGIADKPTDDAVERRVSDNRNQELDDNVQAVLNAIMHALEASPLPSPPLQGEGTDPKK